MTMRMVAEHLVSLVEGAALFVMMVFVMAMVRDLWLSLRDDK